MATLLDFLHKINGASCVAPFQNEINSQLETFYLPKKLKSVKVFDGKQNNVMIFLQSGGIELFVNQLAVDEIEDGIFTFTKARLRLDRSPDRKHRAKSGVEFELSKDPSLTKRFIFHTWILPAR